MKPTKQQIEKFDELLSMTESQHQMTRITGRLKMKRFIEEHGKELCDLMFEEVKDR